MLPKHPILLITIIFLSILIHLNLYSNFQHYSAHTNYVSWQFVLSFFLFFFKYFFIRTVYLSFQSNSSLSQRWSIHLHKNFPSATRINLKSTHDLMAKSDLHNRAIHIRLFNIEVIYSISEDKFPVNPLSLNH